MPGLWLWGQASLVAAEAGEGRLVLGVDSSAGVTTAATGVVVTARSTLTTTLTTTTATAATAAAATTATTRSSVSLNEARVEVNGLLDLALALALGLAAGGSEVLLLGVLESLGVGPLLVELAALVGLTDGKITAKGGLLLGHLVQVLLV